LARRSSIKSFFATTIQNTLLSAIAWNIIPESIGFEESAGRKSYYFAGKLNCRTI
jgi:hypothetical protein